MPETPPDQKTTVGKPPHPGSKAMPRWEAAELIDAPRFTTKNWFALLGPGLLMGGACIGGGEWLMGPLVSAKYGGALLWVATLSILGQVVYNIEISRYTLYTGEPIFTGKFRTLPGPWFWLFVYLVLDLGCIFPYLAANAATPVATVIKGGIVPQPQIIDASLPWHDFHRYNADWWMMKSLGYAIFLLALVPLMVGGKIYNSLKILMTAKIIIVLGFLLFLAVFYSSLSTWCEIGSGFLKFGNVPIRRAEDLNGNHKLDLGEDWDGDGHLDVVEPFIDRDGDGQPDDPDGDGRPEFDDIDGDGFRDGDNVDNVFLALFRSEGLRGEIDLTLVSFIAALAAIAGAGGLTNTPISNYTRDQGWGMGHHVGAIPSMIGGRNIQLSHVGTVFPVTDQSLPRWKRWYKHVCRDQLAVWMPACFIGLALPSMLSVEYLRRGFEADNWTAAAMTAGGVYERVANPPADAWIGQFLSGSGWGGVFWFMTLFCGFLVLGPSMSPTADGVIRRWVDVLWTASPRLRTVDPRRIRFVYFYVLAGYALFGLTMLTFGKPVQLVKYATMLFNYALGFSCFHTLAVNMILLPRELRPGWFIRIAMIAAGLFFTLLATITTLRELGIL